MDCCQVKCKQQENWASGFCHGFSSSTSLADTWRTRTDAYPQYSGFAMITARERPRQEPETSARTIGEDVYAMNDFKG